jgi:hypothetical protein
MKRIYFTSVDKLYLHDGACSSLRVDVAEVNMQPYKVEHYQGLDLLDFFNPLQLLLKS